MAIIAPTRSDLSQILLVASDQSYDADVSTGAFLSEHPDSVGLGANDYPNTMPSAWNALGLSDWIVKQRFNYSETGFGATIYQKANADGSADYVVALQGTRGSNIQDWGGNLIYGWDKWSHQTVQGPNPETSFLAYILSLPNVNKIHFTGQSLGGALAQYAAYEYFDRRVSAAPDSREAVRASMTLTTFNGLGATDGLAKGLVTQGRTFTPELLADVDTAHFWIPNDMVSRLGGGNLNGAGSEYVLGFRKASDAGVPAVRATDNSPIALDFLSAHRIETGFYRGFNLAADHRATASRWTSRRHNRRRFRG